LFPAAVDIYLAIAQQPLIVGDRSPLLWMLSERPVLGSCKYESGCLNTRMCNRSGCDHRISYLHENMVYPAGIPSIRTEHRLQHKYHYLVYYSVTVGSNANFNTFSTK